MTWPENKSEGSVFAGTRGDRHFHRSRTYPSWPVSCYSQSRFGPALRSRRFWLRDMHGLWDYSRSAWFRQGLTVKGLRSAFIVVQPCPFDVGSGRHRRRCHVRHSCLVRHCGPIGSSGQPTRSADRRPDRQEGGNRPRGGNVVPLPRIRQGFGPDLLDQHVGDGSSGGFAIVAIGKTVWIQPNDKFWGHLGIPASEVSLVHGLWLKFTGTGSNSLSAAIAPLCNANKL